MIPPGSRYEQAERVFAPTHVYDSWGVPILEGELPNLTVQVVSREATYIRGTVSPLQQTQEYYAKDTEDVQWLAYKFLGDARRWWEVADANPEIRYPLDITAGMYMRVPIQ